MSEQEKVLYEARKQANEEELKQERARIRALNTSDAIYSIFLIRH